MSDEVERLKRAMKFRGYKKFAALARDAHVPAGTLRMQVQRGSIPKDDAAKYAKVLKVSLDWLLEARGADPFMGATPVEQTAHRAGDSKVLIDPFERAVAIVQAYPGFERLSPKERAHAIKALEQILRDED